MLKVDNIIPLWKSVIRKTLSVWHLRLGLVWATDGDNIMRVPPGLHEWSGLMGLGNTLCQITESFNTPTHHTVEEQDQPLLLP